MLLCAASPTHASVHHTVDVVTLVHETRAEHPDGDALPRTRKMLEALLLAPASAYSDVAPSPAFLTSTSWEGVVTKLPKGVDADAALAILRLDLGATRARPVTDVAPTEGFQDPFVAASATKAGIDPDIFWQALDLTGFRHSTRAATYGVAAQMLRDKLATLPPPQQQLTGVDSDVLDRFMQARHIEALSQADLGYLSVLVQHGFVHWRTDSLSPSGARTLPTPLRVARLAAAYRDAEGYLGGFPCRRDATPNAQHAGTGQPGDTRPLCFVAATDHAVLLWYREEVRRQAAWRPLREKRDRSGLLGLFALMVPLFDLAAVLESTEAIIAEDLAASNALTRPEITALSNDADLLACRIPL